MPFFNFSLFSAFLSTLPTLPCPHPPSGLMMNTTLVGPCSKSHPWVWRTGSSFKELALTLPATLASGLPLHLIICNKWMEMSVIVMEWMAGGLRPYWATGMGWGMLGPRVGLPHSSAKTSTAWRQRHEQMSNVSFMPELQMHLIFQWNDAQITYNALWIIMLVNFFVTLISKL